MKMRKSVKSLVKRDKYDPSDVKSAVSSCLSLSLCHAFSLHLSLYDDLTKLRKRNKRIFLLTPSRIRVFKKTNDVDDGVQIKIRNKREKRWITTASLTKD